MRHVGIPGSRDKPLIEFVWQQTDSAALRYRIIKRLRERGHSLKSTGQCLGVSGTQARVTLFKGKKAEVLFDDQIRGYTERPWWDIGPPEWELASHAP